MTSLWRVSNRMPALPSLVPNLMPICSCYCLHFRPCPNLTMLANSVSLTYCDRSKLKMFVFDQNQSEADNACSRFACVLLTDKNIMIHKYTIWCDPVWLYFVQFLYIFPMLFQFFYMLKSVDLLYVWFAYSMCVDSKFLIESQYSRIVLVDMFWIIGCLFIFDCYDFDSIKMCLFSVVCLYRLFLYHYFVKRALCFLPTSWLERSRIQWWTNII